jgi:hypothetical protein
MHTIWLWTMVFFAMGAWCLHTIVGGGKHQTVTNVLSSWKLPELTRKYHWLELQATLALKKELWVSETWRLRRQVVGNKQAHTEQVTVCCET